MNIFITGGAGYVGEMLCDQLSKDPRVSKIITLDKEPQSDFSKEIKNLVYIQANTSDDSWQEQVSSHKPDVVIHTAWQIRAMYGDAKTQWKWNVDGSKNIFEFALNTDSVSKLIYFSTASSYAAQLSNTLDHYFTEEEGFRDDGYIYAHEKKVTEELLHDMYHSKKESGARTPQVSIVRPAAITGPRGRFMRIRFGLQSALQGNLEKGLVNKVVTTLTSWVPATSSWVRQFIHEDDVNDIVTQFALDDMDWEYNVFNITPTGDPVYAQDMAAAVDKKILPIQPWMARSAFFFFWHATRGKIPTCPGSWRFYSYPVLMSGEKLATVYTCKHTSPDAFSKTAGRYEYTVPEDMRVS